jgi:cell wall assembly regulator SMI1
MARDVWNWDWLPLCEDGVGTMLVIDAAVDNAPRYVCPVLYRAHDDGSNAAVVAASIGALVRQWTFALEVGRGAYNADHDRSELDLEMLPASFDHRLL